MNVVYVTGNSNKAKYFSKLLGMDIEHHPADVDEIQSLDHIEVVEAKARAAYEQIGRPVIVEDTSLVINSMGRLPGTLIKWFLQEIGTDGLCHLANSYPDRGAHASAIFVYFDGNDIKYFEGGLNGKISDIPRGSSEFGWNPVFIPEGSNQTLGEMDEQDFETAYAKVKPFSELRQFLASLQSSQIT